MTHKNIASMMLFFVKIRIDSRLMGGVDPCNYGIFRNNSVSGKLRITHDDILLSLTMEIGGLKDRSKEIYYLDNFICDMGG
jgi:hypothetical protein